MTASNQQNLLVPWNPEALPRDRRHQQLVAAILNALIRAGLLVQSGEGWSLDLSDQLAGMGGSGYLLPSKGQDGNRWLLVNDPGPVPDQGNPGDLALSFPSGNVYQKRLRGLEPPRWALIQNLRRGPQGPQGLPGRDGRNGTDGARGPQGTAGAAGSGNTTTSGTIASLPAAGTAGNLYLPTDEPVLLRDNGASWDSFGPIFTLTSPGSTAGWSWVNQSTATITTTSASWTFQVSGGTGFNLFTVAAPATPWKMDFLFQPSYTGPNAAVSTCCACFLNSGSGAFHEYEFRSDGTNAYDWMGVLGSYKYTDVNTFNSLYFDRLTWNPGWGHRFVRVGDDGSNRYVAFSGDGQNFAVGHTIGRTDFVTADRIGFGVSNTGSGTFTMKILHLVGP